MSNENLKIFFNLVANIFLAISAQDIFENDLSRSYTFVPVINTSRFLDSDDQILATRKSRSAVDCAHKCLTKTQCWVIGYNAISGICWLMKSASRNGVLKAELENLILMKVRFEALKENSNVEEFSSCKEVVEKGRSKGNGVYNIKTNQSSSTMTYCHMDTLSACGGGGWTLTMKINGSKNTFEYDSSYWTNKQSLKTENGLGLEDKESKLPAYWSTPLTKICLGMKSNDVIKWIKLELKHRAASLLDVISTGYPKELYTLLGANKWKETYIPTVGDTMNYPREGVSVSLNIFINKVKVRLGLLYLGSSGQISYLGFGTWGYWHRYGIELSCGYGKGSYRRTGIIKKPSFCYILVQ